MDEKRIIELVILYSKDELTTSEASKLEIWLKVNEQNRGIFCDYLKRYRKARQIAFYDTVDEQRAWNQLARKIKRASISKKNRFVQYSLYAASLLLFVSFSLFLYIKNGSVTTENSLRDIPSGSAKAMLQLSDGRIVPLSNDSVLSLAEINGVVIMQDEEGGIRYLAGEGKNETVFNTIRVPRGGEYYLCLSDGTKVWLNSESELTYPVSSLENARNVYLKGEAYFEVARDEKHPFRVECEDSKITVLGTKFNVMAYKGQGNVVTTLVDGRVRVATGRDSLMLTPGEQAVSGTDGIDVKKVDVSFYIAWTLGVFEFEEMSLGQITEQLGRWYDMTFVYDDPLLREITFTGVAERHRPLDVVLKMIEKLSGVRFEVKNDVITIYKK